MNIDKQAVKRMIDKARLNELHIYNVNPTDKDSGKRAADQVAKLLSKNSSATVVVISS
jgi:hypothetical protein